MDYMDQQDNPCCDKHNFQPYSLDWYACIDSQPTIDDGSSDFEYMMYDEMVDVRGGACPDELWYGD